MEDHIKDLEAIASSSSNDFDSILGAYDRAGSLYSKVASVYGNYISSLNTPEMQAVQTKMAPILSRHRSKCYNVPGLFAKIEQMHAMKEEMSEKGEWTAEQARLAERVYIGFERMGAKLSEEGKRDYADIQGEILFRLNFTPYFETNLFAESCPMPPAEQATLQTSFVQNVFKD
jgi:peptidyl-dipeptidase Dcp